MSKKEFREITLPLTDQGVTIAKEYDSKKRLIGDARVSTYGPTLDDQFDRMQRPEHQKVTSGANQTLGTRLGWPLSTPKRSLGPVGATGSPCPRNGQSFSEPEGPR
jgi:hypothetical protein